MLGRVLVGQREELRARFPGVPGDLVNFFLFIAEEVRAGLAELGFSSLDEIVGRTDVLRRRADVQLYKTSSVDLSYLTTVSLPLQTGAASGSSSSPSSGSGEVSVRAALALALAQALLLSLPLPLLLALALALRLPRSYCNCCLGSAVGSQGLISATSLPCLWPLCACGRAVHWASGEEQLVAARPGGAQQRAHAGR